MKNFGYEFNILYGFIGLIMVIAGVAMLFVGDIAPVILGLIFIPIGALLAYLGIKSLIKVKQLIAEDKINRKLEIDAKNEAEINAKINGLCPSCGIKIDKENVFCSNCGYKL